MYALFRGAVTNGAMTAGGLKAPLGAIAEQPTSLIGSGSESERGETEEDLYNTCGPNSNITRSTLCGNNTSRNSGNRTRHRPGKERHHIYAICTCTWEGGGRGQSCSKAPLSLSLGSWRYLGVVATPPKEGTLRKVGKVPTSEIGWLR